jgi:trehalose 2-sulfotransferase
MKRDIVICATQRSGSTLLCEDMRATRRLGQPNEFFVPCLSTVAVPDWPERLAADRQRFSTPNDVYGVKVMMNYLGAIDAALAEAFGTPPVTDAAGPFPHFRAYFADACFIWLRRINLTEQAISREMARQTGVTHAVEDTGKPFFAGKSVVAFEGDYNRSAVVEVDDVISEINAVAAENEKWLYFFSRWGIEPLMLEYETILDDPRAHVRRIAEFAGVDLPDWQPQRRLKKLANARSAELYERVLDRLMRS